MKENMRERERGGEEKVKESKGESVKNNRREEKECDGGKRTRDRD